MARRYIRHHNGTVHSVDAAVFNQHLASARSIRYDDPATEIAREATPAEVAAYWERQGFVYLPESDEALSPDEAAARAPKAADRPAAKAATKDA